MTGHEETIKAIKALLTESFEGSLATLDDGKPFVSAAGFIWDEAPKGAIQVYLLLSDLARHSQHIKKNPKVSLLITESAGNKFLYEKKRVTLGGQIQLVEEAAGSLKLKEKYLKRYPKAEIFFTLKDFKFYRLIPDELYWIGGFGKAEVIKCSMA